MKVQFMRYSLVDGKYVKLGKVRDMTQESIELKLQEYSEKNPYSHYYVVYPESQKFQRV
jgi:hypothetical protein